MSGLLNIGGQALSFELLERKGGSVRFSYNGKEYCFTGKRLVDGSFMLQQEVAPECFSAISGYASAAGRQGTRLQLGALEAIISEQTAQSEGASAQARLSPLAPMPGMVRQLLVSAGEKVATGQALVVIEAMKLQLTLSAGGDATVDSILVSVGQMVGEGAELVKLTAIT